MTKSGRLVAVSGFTFCLSYFSIAFASVFLSGSGVAMTQEHNIYSGEYFAWRQSNIGELLGVIQNAVFAVIWIHIIVFLRKFKEYLFIDLVIILHVLWMLYISLYGKSPISTGTILLVSYADIIVTCVSFWLIKSPPLKPFMRWYTIVVATIFFIIPSTGWLVDNFGLQWAWINPIILNLVPYSLLTVFFLGILTRSPQSLSYNQITQHPE